MHCHSHSDSKVEAEVLRRRKEISSKYEAWRPRWPQIRTITPRELHSRLQTDIDSWVLVDIRTQAEQDVSMLPGAITQREFEADLDSIKAESSKKIVTYCTAGYRSGEYAASLISAHQIDGSRVYNLEGSLLAWSHESLPLAAKIDGKEVDTKRIHVFAPSWSLEGPGYTPVLFTKPTMWESLNALVVLILSVIRAFVARIFQLLRIGGDESSKKKPV